MSRILVVEDHPDVRFAMEHVLLDAGYEVDVIGTMIGGAELLGSGSYDLVIADGRLPDGNGMAVAEKAGEAGAKALIITGYALSLPGELLARYEVLLKPVRARELIEAVKRMIGD